MSALQTIADSRYRPVLSNYLVTHHYILQETNTRIKSRWQWRGSTPLLLYCSVSCKQPTQPTEPTEQIALRLHWREAYFLFASVRQSYCGTGELTGSSRGSCLWLCVHLTVLYSNVIRSRLSSAFELHLHSKRQKIHCIPTFGSGSPLILGLTLHSLRALESR